MMNKIIAAIADYQREHDGAKPTAVTLGDEEWLALGRDIAMLPPVPEGHLTVHGVPVRRVKAPGMRVLG